MTFTSRDETASSSSPTPVVSGATSGVCLRRALVAGWPGVSTSAVISARTAFGPSKRHLKYCGSWLLRLLLPLLRRCHGGAVMHVLLLCGSTAAALAMSPTCFAADPREHGYYASHPLSVMCLGILKLKD